MNCNEVQWQLIAYLDGELPDSVSAEIRAHLAECQICSQERTSYEALQAAMSEWTVTPGTIWDALSRQITPMPEPVKRKPTRSPSVLMPYSPSDYQRLV